MEEEGWAGNQPMNQPENQQENGLENGQEKLVEKQSERVEDFDVSLSRYKCQKCKDTGMIKEADGSCHTCFECLVEGRLDQHSSKISDSRIRL